MNSKLIKTLLFFLSVFLLIIISETSYQLQHNPDLKFLYEVSFSLLEARLGYVRGSYKHFENASEIKLTQLSSKGYGDRTELNKLSSLPNNQKLLDDFGLTFTNLKVNKLANSYEVWGKVFYQLGLSAYKNNEADLLVPLWQNAIAIAPQWSYFHVELANYYLLKGEKTNAETAIINCQKFEFAKQHCILFFNENLNKGVSEEVGFLANIINEKI